MINLLILVQPIKIISVIAVMILYRRFLLKIATFYIISKSMRLIFNLKKKKKNIEQIN